MKEYLNEGAKEVAIKNPTLEDLTIKLDVELDELQYSRIEIERALERVDRSEPKETNEDAVPERPVISLVDKLDYILNKLQKERKALYNMSSKLNNLI